MKAIETITPRMLRVVFEGEALAGFGPAKPSAHIKILFDAPPYLWTPESEGPRPPSRTYTPRSFDPARNELAVEFALHGEGLASDWVRRAQPGDPVWIAGPGGGFEPSHDLRSIVMVCDDTALPAAAMIAEALPATCHAQIVCEVEDAAEQRDIGPLAADTVRWVHRRGAVSGDGLIATLPGIDAPEGALWWVACEAGAMRRMRTSLIREHGVAPASMITRGYWRAGEANHPDHDYGAD